MISISEPTGALQNYFMYPILKVMVSTGYWCFYCKLKKKSQFEIVGAIVVALPELIATFIV